MLTSFCEVWCVIVHSQLNDVDLSRSVVESIRSVGESSFSGNTQGGCHLRGFLLNPKSSVENTGVIFLLQCSTSLTIHILCGDCHSFNWECLLYYLIRALLYWALSWRGEADAVRHEPGELVERD